MSKAKVILLVAGILLLAGCGNKAVDKSSELKAENKSGGSGMISSIKDAMGLGKTMRCTYRIQDQNGQSEVVTYVDGKKYATEMNIVGNKQRMVYNEEAMYSWQEGQKQGMKMTNDCMKEMNADMPEDEADEVDMPKELDIENAFDQAMDVKCEEVSSADFSIPANVEFGDQCEMMRNMMKNIPQGAGAQNGAGMPGGIPGGMNIPQIP